MSLYRQYVIWMTAIVICIAFPLSAFAADATPPLAPSHWHTTLYHTGWTKKDGAPTGATFVTQDNNGMLWFSAPDGLYHFDGSKFERTDEIDGNKLLSPNTFCVSIYDDALWVGYQFGGVSVFEHGKVRHYGVKDGAPDHTVFQFAKTQAGAMWLTSSIGVFWLDGQRWRHVDETDGLPAGSIHNMRLLPDGSILAFHPEGVYRNSPDGHRFHLAIAQRGILKGKLLPDGSVLVSTATSAQIFQPTTGKLTPLVLPKSEGIHQFPTSDAHGHLWISTSTGIQLLDSTLQPQKTSFSQSDFTGKFIQTSISDHEGNFWIITDNGIDRIRETRLTTVDLPEEISSINVVAGTNGSVWISNSYGDNSVKEPTFGITHDGQPLKSQAKNITSSLHDGDGSVWFASSKALWHQQDTGTQKWDLPPDLRGAEVQAMAMDPEGTLWLSVVRRGVHTFRDGVWSGPGGHAELQPTAVSLLADGQQRLWFGYPANQMALLEKGVVQHFGPGDGLDVGNVLAMSNRFGRLWVGGERGLAYLDGRHFVTLKDGGDNFRGVSGIVETAAGEIWLHGPDGLIRVRKEDLASALQSHSNSVHGEPFNYLDGHVGAPIPIRPLPTLVEATDGRLWYATSNSAGWIDPQHIARNTLAPKTLVTALKAGGKSYVSAPTVNLPQHTTNLEIDFTAASLSIPERVRFRYRLVGLDTQWRDSEGRRQVFYTNLGPGDYHFEVMAANEDGVWSTSAASLAFHIEPSFTQTIWFELTCGIAALVIGYLLYLWRVAQVTIRIGERLQERALERERIARTLHDTFLQSVQALIMRFHMIKADLPATDPVQEQIDDALQSAEDVVREGRDQVMDLRLTNVYGGDLVKALSDVGDDMAAQHDIAFSLKSIGESRKLAAMAQDEVFAIGREALFNAFRHAGGSDVVVELDFSAATFCMTIRDNGKGLDDSVKAAGYRPGHWGLTGMRERAARVYGALTIESASDNGTAVQLCIPGGKAYR